MLRPFLALAVLAPALAANPELPTDPDELAREGTRVIADLLGPTIPGASAALVLPGGEVVAFATGRTELEGGRPLTVEDRMLSGSVGKTYVAASALSLAAGGKLDLDRSIDSYFEGAKAPWMDRIPNGGALTVRQLLRHQSGIPRYVFHSDFLEEVVSDADRVWQPEELLSFVFDAEPLFAPGEGWAYSDTNYIVVGLVVERVSETTFYEFAKRELLDRHGLAETIPSDRRELEGVVQGHVTLGRDLGFPERSQEDGVFVFNPQFEWCGGGWACTPRDLARWARLLYGGEALEEPYLDELLDGVPADALAPGMEYGLAAMLVDTEAGPYRGHDGFMPGYLTSTGYFPELDIAVAVQLNGDDVRALGRRLTGALADLALLVE